MLNKVTFDWLSFTIKERDINGVLRDLGIDTSNYTPAEFGRFGYAKMLSHDVCDIQILYDGTEDMGIHVVIPGKSIKCFMTDFVNNSPFFVDTPFGRASDKDYFVKLAEYVLENGKFSRVDVNIDTVMEPMNPYFLNHLRLDGFMISRFRKWRFVESSDKSATFYIGARTSPAFIRIYDKAKERGDFKSTLYRFEIQFGKLANDFMKSYVVHGLPVAFRSYIESVLRFVTKANNYDSANRSFWNDFLDLISNGEFYDFRFFEERKKKTCVDSLLHMFKQYSNVIDDFLSEFGDMDDYFEFLIACLEDNRCHDLSRKCAMQLISDKGWCICD